jgi:molybdenum cofactor cytidylyltransferase
VIAAIILAAGYSSRMGRPKALLDWHGHTFLAIVHAGLVNANSAPIVVVIGADSNAIKEAHAGLDVTWVRNPDPSHGMLSSFRCGLRVLCEQSVMPMGVMLCLVDHPAVAQATYPELARHAAPDAIIIPECNGRRGHPVIFGNQFVDELLAGDCPEGARSVVRAHPGAVQVVPVDDPGVLLDIDTPDEYDRATE